MILKCALNDNYATSLRAVETAGERGVVTTQSGTTSMLPHVILSRLTRDQSNWLVRNWRPGDKALPVV